MISRFIRRDTDILPDPLRKNITVIHYYNEIIRFWNKINFIIKKTLGGSNSLDSVKLPKYLYATYRMLWEHASEKKIINELKEINEEFLKKIKIFSWKKALINKVEKEKLSILEAIPSFMIEHLLPVMSINFLKSNIQFMNGLQRTVEITIRINNLCSKENSENLFTKIKENLKKNGINYRKDLNLPDLFWIPRSQKSRVIRSSYYQNGNLILQDKASAAVIQALAPKKEDKVCDMCAAPGIKTSFIAQYMNNKGHIIAGEFLTERVNMMVLLLKQLNVLNVHILNTDSIIFPIRFQNYFDCILLDAPCTGSGALLVSPELKWRQNQGFLHQNIIVQKKLIENAIKMLRPGGILVYSTCSLYAEEGENQILDFIDNLEPLDLPNWLSPSYKVEDNTIPGTGRLFPSLHHTQGFFIGKFKKKEI